jgi:hypothetical protein
MANGSTADKARKARVKADEAKYYGGDSRSIASKVAKTATGQDLTMNEEYRAGKIIQNRRTLDTGKTAARASFMERRVAKKNANDRVKAAIGGGAPKKQAPKATASAKTKAALPKEGRANMLKSTAKKPVAKPATKTTPMPKTTKKAPAKMTPQDAAMKKILEKKNGKIYG